MNIWQPIDADGAKVLWFSESVGNQGYSVPVITDLDARIARIWLKYRTQRVDVRLLLHLSAQLSTFYCRRKPRRGFDIVPLDGLACCSHHCASGTRVCVEARFVRSAGHDCVQFGAESVELAKGSRHSA